jgi:hypothetical protein
VFKDASYGALGYDAGTEIAKGVQEDNGSFGPHAQRATTVAAGKVMAVIAADAGFGAAIGSFVGPEGTAGGALIGAGVAAVSSGVLLEAGGYFAGKIYDGVSNLLNHPFPTNWT